MTGWWLLIVWGLVLLGVGYLVGFTMAAGHLPGRRRR